MRRSASQALSQLVKSGVVNQTTQSSNTGRGLLLKRLTSNSATGSSTTSGTSSRLEAIATKRAPPIDLPPNPVGVAAKASRGLAAVPAIPKLLGFAGAIPFVLSVPYVLQAFQFDSLIDQAARGQVAYGALIVTFLGAVHWGAAMNSTLSGPRAAHMLRERYVWSVFPSLAAWPALMMETGPGAVVVSLLLGVCYLSDRSYSRMGAVPAWYLTLRNWLTPLAMVSTLSTVMYLVSKDVEKAKIRMEEEDRERAEAQAAAARAAAAAADEAEAEVQAKAAKKGWWGRK